MTRQHNEFQSSSGCFRVTPSHYESKYEFYNFWTANEERRKISIDLKLVLEQVGEAPYFKINDNGFIHRVDNEKCPGVLRARNTTRTEFKYK